MSSHIAYLVLGTNLGNRSKNLSTASSEINDIPKTKVSLKTKKQINIDTNSESPVELEWDLNNNEDKDEDGQMKIF